METDLDDFTDYASEAPLPPPRGTPYDRSPMLSRHPSRGQSPNMAGNPIPPPDRRRMSSQIHDGAFDETISILDPRRFTPTLHANLVAEILSLRRELESKNGLVETLENELDATRVEHENANEAVATALKEARDVKRQLARAEKDDAMAVVAQERDEAVQALADSKKQMERLSKSRRAAEEDLEQLRKAQERDSERFEEAKRGFERRAHVAEGRLKAVLDEIAAARASAMSPPPPAPPTMAHHPSHQRVMSEDYGDFHGGSDTRSIRSSTMSIGDRPSSLMMGDDEAERLGISLHGNGGGLSLADELNFDQSEDDEGTGTEREQTDAEPEDMVSDTESVEDVDELPELADMGIQCEPEINFEERALELEDLLDERAVELERAYNTIQQKTEEMDALYSELDTAHNRAFDLEEKLDFLNTQGLANRSSELDERAVKLDERSVELDGRTTGLDERRAALESMYIELEARETELRQEADVMREINEERSASLDDREIELEDRERVLSAEEAEIKELKEWVDQELNLIKEGKEEAIAMKPKPLMQSAGIQTDAVRPPKPTILRVPAIMVSPPEPTPPLPKPAMRNASAQTRPQRMRTRSMQTQQIGLDERLRKFAPHLLPSALLPKAPVPVPVEVEPTPPESPAFIPRRSSKRTARRSVTAPIPAPSEPEPGMHDMGVGTTQIYSSPKTDDEIYLTRARSRKEMVPKNLFNNIDLSPDNEVGSSGDDGFPDEGDSGSEYRTALSAPKPRGARRNTPALKLNMPMAVADADIPRRQASVRRGAMVASGVAAHGRVRSPSLTSNRTSESGNTSAVAKVGPPFPVPTRHSSKRPGYLSDRDRATPSPTGSQKLKRGSSSRPKPPRPQSIRKVRSATVLPSTRDGTRSPPPLSTSSIAPSSPGLPPPLPRDEISSTAFDRRGFGQSRHRHQASNNTQNTMNTNNTSNTLNTSTTVTTNNPGQVSGGTVQQTSVVDAIAQTMVGEWMWKYVRRRRSFGVSDANPQGDDSAGGQRHKRWVWLAPYERAVMWSSRQPTSGSALLGKSGRKLLIQSVLDVKDDTPLPKGAAQTVFNRSILILTPARALKFTAPSRERHYVWLTALSFLSHSAESNDGLLALPPPMPFEYDQVDRRHPAPPPVPPAAPARLNAFSATRDSVRLTKGKGRVSPSANNSAYPSAHGSAAVSPGLLNPGAMASTETLSAEPPTIPRFPGTSRRRRSNSNMHRPQTRGGYEKSLESYSTSNAGSTNGDSFRPDSFYGVGGIGLPAGNAAGNAGGGASGWDAGPVGTVRMEAFIDRQTQQYEDYDVDDTSSRPDSYHVKRDRRASRHEAYWGRGAGFYGAPEDFWRGGDDPFRGF
ncbi:meiotic cell cortex C-terminal pleckstrin homology-domain-containing protein [Tricharina praecox]|uniref:meiotic cell cortex C-terminal pleckstrin homology-domain-containing protein n=1 Tax=Tricharina praecox TaxID=43433 RepID=UPI00221E3A59|nr:meiotic cell cortex C-terminal pleckstrin homology-domain-containing protein [Tricharina praecox]KAI5856805.1 meiotic cell cortex C-terminal pleckstrin homology-domain-containing protein [Tricharina praecox]